MATFLSLGFTAQLGQLVMMRELLVPFQGSEITFALILGAWLLWTAAGSYIVHRLGPDEGSPVALRTWFAAVSVLVCMAMPVDVLGIRMLRTFCGVQPGEYLPLSKLIAAAFVLLAPVGLGLGAQFVLASRALRNAAAVYTSESAGSAVAGFLLSVWLVPALDAFQLVFLAGVIQLLTAAVVLFPMAGLRGRPVGPLLVMGLAIVVAAILLVLGPVIDHATRAAFWRGFHPRASLVTTAESPYGHLAVLADQGQFSVYRSGRLVACLPDRGEAAPAAQLFMAQSPQPSRVLLIGGGIAGLAKNVLLHPVEHVDCVEFDPLLVDMARKFAGADDLRALNDRRLAFQAADGRAFLRQGSGGYDLIVVTVGDPDTAQINRFYTEEFFQEARGKLTPGGVLCLGPLTTVESYQVGPTLERNACLYWTLRRAFARVLATPGPAFCLLASNAADTPTLAAPAVFGRLEARGIGAVNLSGFLDEFGVAQVNAELRTGRRYNPLKADAAAPDAPVPANTDQRPRAYYLGMQMWARVVGDRAMSALLEPMENPYGWWAAGFIVVAFAALLFGVAWRRTGAVRVPAVAFGAFASGLSGMTVALLVLFAFQNAFGSIYQSVGLVLALFMTGLALGSGWAQRPCGTDRARCCTITVQLVMAGFLLALPNLLKGSASGGTTTLQVLGFGLTNLLGGALTGAYYPLAVTAARGTEEGRDWSGALYASDLAGGCLGAFVVAAFLAPRFGCRATAAGCAVLCAMAATLLRTARPKCAKEYEP